jgi:hypothetical protein
MAPAAIPAWVVYAGLAAAVAGAAASGYGAYQTGQNQKKEAEYNQDVAESEALASKQKAEFDMETSQKRFKALMGHQIASYSKAGVDITSGSPLLLLAAQAEEGERERQAIKYGGDVGASRMYNQGNIFSMQGKNAATAGTIGAGGTLLSGISSAASYGYQMGGSSATKK